MSLKEENIITPMKRFRNSLNKFSEICQPYFKNVNLNKSSSKYNPIEYSYSKGVESEFISIFKSNLTDLSFAFSFTYMNLETEKQLVEVSHKILDNDSIITTKPLSLEEFKNKLNLLNKELLTKNKITEKDIWNSFTSIFELTSVNIKKDIINIQEKLQQKIEDKKTDLNLESLEKNYNNTKILYQDGLQLLETEINNSSELKIIKNLEKKLRIAQKSLENKKSNLYKSLNIPSLDNNYREARTKLNTAQKELTQFIEIEKKQIPKSTIKKLKIR